MRHSLRSFCLLVLVAILLAISANRAMASTVYYVPGGTTLCESIGYPWNYDQGLCDDGSQPFVTWAMIFTYSFDETGYVDPDAYCANIGMSLMGNNGDGTFTCFSTNVSEGP